MTTQRTFNIAILGRLLEHLGSQMYKRRDTALAELVANAWDAGATEVDVALPTGTYSPISSEICIIDNGVGMTDDQVQNEYLIVGRNRRVEAGPAIPQRKIMGRKGIGKLAGFGIARTIEVETTAQNKTTHFSMSLDELKDTTNEVTNIPILGNITEELDKESGTTIRLKHLKHLSAPDTDALKESLGRRFSRVVHGEMSIKVNGEEVSEPSIDFEFREPSEGWNTAQVGQHKVRYYYGFSRVVLKSNLLRGFTLYANGKTAQAPPFYFDVESTASGQHGTRYLYGAAEIDFLDEGTDDESDLISTDRQEIDWEADRVEKLKSWGAKVTRQALREWSNRRETAVRDTLYGDERLRARIERLDKSSQKNLEKILRVLARSEASEEYLFELASSLVSAFEYRHFHDVVKDIENLEEPAELVQLLEHLRVWKVLESRAILEVINGRLQIIDKFHSMLINDAPETAPRKGMDNLHDLIANYPWLLNPEWQVLSEERRLTTQLREWGDSDIDPNLRQRYDFLALTNDQRTVVVEIKRSGHSVVLEDLHRLQQYRANLERGEGRAVTMALVSGPEWAINRAEWINQTALELLEWGEVQVRIRKYYEQYRSLLKADIENNNFGKMESEVARTRGVIDRGSYRGPGARKEGLGEQYVGHEEG